MILIAGATGILGGIIAQRLLGEGKQVRILVRHNSPAEELAQKGMATSPQVLVEAGAEPVYGDLKDTPSLHRACKGITTLITTANSAMRGGEDNVDTVDRQGNRSLIEAAQATGIRQYIFISFLGADLNHPVPIFQAKAEIETTLADCGMPYTILSPNFFMENWIGMVIGTPILLGQPITLVGQGQRLHSLVSIRDVSAFATAVVDHPAAINQRIILGGPDPISWHSIVETCRRVLGKALPVNFVAPGETIPGLPEIVPGVLAGMETYDSPIPMQETARIFGVNQIPLESVIRNMLDSWQK